MVKIYQNGADFIAENKNLLLEEPVQTAYFFENAPYIESIKYDSYAIKIEENGLFILALKRQCVNMVVFGSFDLACKLAQVLYDLHFLVDGVLTSPTIGTKLLCKYCRLANTTYQLLHSMDIMESTSPMPTDESLVSLATMDDVDELVELRKVFINEAKVNLSTSREGIVAKIGSIYVIKRDNKIISMALKRKENEVMAGISWVLTPKEYRGQGLAKIVVGTIRNEIVRKGKIAYLFVDKQNPISNHVYSSIGFDYLTPQSDFYVSSTNIRRTMLAGGCFWCISSFLNDLKGIINIESGYAGGNVLYPSYEEVKKGNTNHLEAIMITYDSDVLSYKDLLIAFMESIDPFDAEGQFTDQGTNYKTAVFTSSINEIDTFNSIKAKIETKYQKEVKVMRLEDTIFFKAEEYHQDYFKKNPDKLNEELQETGRITFDFIKVE